ncbi:magnesium transporter, partial [Chlamydoabsidia padenii]
MAGEDAVNFVIGVFVSLGASFMDALGLNILKLDHVKEGQKDAATRRGDCGRPLWHIGLYTYVASQLIGSTIALNYLKTQWVAPLGSVALIYNFIFAKILVGTNITRKDVFGTLVVVASVIWIVVFGGIALNIITLSGLALAIWSRWTLSDESKRPAFMTMSPKKMRRMVGLMFSLDGGLLASETLLLAKSGVKLFTLSISSQVNQFTDNTSRFIILALIITAVLQVYCLNTALKLYSSVVVVPVFYGTYTAIGLVNTIIYLDEINNYPGWAISLVFAGIGVLIYGVYLLSAKPDPNSQQSDHDEE